MTNHAVPLDPLQGTPRQIEWAERIRTNATPVVARWVAGAWDQFDRELTTPAKRTKRGMSLYLQQRAQALEQALRCSRAKFWIEARDCRSPDEFIETFKKWGVK